MTQEQQILQHLMKGKSITPLTALQEYNCFRLSSRIFSLKQQGHPIETEIVTTSTGKRIARYTLKKNLK